MTIVRIEREGGTVLVVQDSFDASDADDLDDLLLRCRDRAVTIDFRAVRRIEDYVMARLADELAQAPLQIIGLTDHQLRLLRYLRPGPGPAARRPRAPGDERADRRLMPEPTTGVRGDGSGET